MINKNRKTGSGSGGDGPDDMIALLSGRVDVSRGTVERLQRFHQLLVQWQKSQNIVASNTLPHIWTRHFADSAQLMPHITKSNSTESNILVDMGAGGGFPGMVLAILMQDYPNFKALLVESNGRKCAFLKDIARASGANVEIHNCRIEDFANESTIPFIDIVTARALKPLHKLLSMGQFAFDKGAFGLFLKGKTSETEIEEAASGWSFEAESFESCTDPEGRIVKITNVKPRL